MVVFELVEATTLLHNSSQILKPFHSTDSSQNPRTEWRERFLSRSIPPTKPIPNTFIYELIFPGTGGISLVHRNCNFLLTFTKSRTNNRIIRSLDRAAKEEKRGGENFRIQNSVNVTWLSEDLSRGSGRELWRGVETRERAGRSRPIKWAAGRYLSWPAMRLPRTSL